MQKPCELPSAADVRTSDATMNAVADTSPSSAATQPRASIPPVRRREELLPSGSVDDARAVLHRALKRAVVQNRPVDSAKVHSARARGDVLGFMDAGVKDRATVCKAMVANAAADGANTLARQLAVLPTRFAGLLIDASMTPVQRAGIGAGRAVGHAYTGGVIRDIVDPLTDAAKRYGRPAPIKSPDDIQAIAHNARLVSDTLKQAVDRGVVLSKPLRDEYAEIQRVLEHYAQRGSLAHAAFGLNMLSEVLKQAGDWVTAVTTAAMEPVVGMSLKAASALVIYPVIDAVTSAINAYQTMDYQALHANVVRKDGSIDEDAMRRLWVSFDQAQDDVIDKILSNHVEKDLRDAHMARIDAGLLRAQAEAPTRLCQDLLRHKAHAQARAEFLAGEIYQLRPLVGKADGATVRHLSFLLDKYQTKLCALGQAGGSDAEHAELERFKDEIQSQARHAAGAIQRELSKHRAVPGGERLATRDLLGAVSFEQVARLAEFAGIRDGHEPPRRHAGTAATLTTLGVAVGEERLVGLERLLAGALRRIEDLDGALAQERAREASAADRPSNGDRQLLLEQADALERKSDAKLAHARRKLADPEAYRLAGVALTASRRAYIAAADSGRPAAERTQLNERAAALDALGNELIATIRPDGQFAKLVASNAKRCLKDMGAHMRLPVRLLDNLDARHPIASALVPALAVGYSGVANLPATSGFVAHVPSVASDVATLGLLHVALGQLIHDSAASRNARSDAETVSYLTAVPAPDGTRLPAAEGPLPPAHAGARQRLLGLLQSMPRDVDVGHLIADANEPVGKSVTQYSRLLVPKLPLARQGISLAHPGDLLQRGVVDPLRKPAAALAHAVRRGPVGAAGLAVSTLRKDPIRWAAQVSKRMLQFLEHAATYAPSVVRGAVRDAPALDRLRRNPDVSKLGFAAAVGTSVTKNLVDPPFLQPVSGVAAGVKALAQGRAPRQALSTARHSALGENTPVHKIARQLGQMERMAAARLAESGRRRDMEAAMSSAPPARDADSSPDEQVTRL